MICTDLFGSLNLFTRDLDLTTIISLRIKKKNKKNYNN